MCGCIPPRIGLLCGTSTLTQGSFLLNYHGGPQTNNAARTNPTGDARLPPIAGLGGLGLPWMENMGMPDPAAFSQLLQNPAMAQMMQSLLSNPQYMDQIVGLNPQLRSMLDMNPQLR